MNRAQRRALEREDKKDTKKNSVTVTHEYLNKVKSNIYKEASARSVDVLMTSFGLTLHEDYGFDIDQIQVCLSRVSEYMGMIERDECDINDLRNKLVEETGLLIASEKYLEEEYKDGIYDDTEE